MELRSSFKGFVGEALYRISPFFLINIIVYFVKDVPVILWVIYAATALFCLYQFVETVLVYLQRVRISEAGLQIVNPLGVISLQWGDIRSATLRERRHSYSRTSRLLNLHSTERSIGVVTSTLSEGDEAELLAFVKARIPLVIQQDR